MSNMDEENPSIRRIADTIKFQNLAKLLEKVVKANPRDKIKPIKSFFEHFRKGYLAEYKTLDSTKANGDSLYSIVRILIPADDRARPAYGFKGAKLSAILAHAIGLDKDSEDGRKLINFKDPTKNTSATRDLGQVVFNIMETRAAHSSRAGPTVQDLHIVLDELARPKEKDPESDSSYIKKQRQVLRSFVPALTPVEGKWLVRILLKTLYLGVHTNAIYKCIHPQAEELYNRTGNLELVCQRLNDPDVEIDLNEVELFQPFRPMLCTRLTKLKDDEDDILSDPSSSKKKENQVELPAPPFLLEIKEQGIMLMNCEKNAQVLFYTRLLTISQWDGERFQIHYDSSRSSNDQFRFYSRRQYNFSPSFNLTLMPELQKQIKSTCKSFILDGEMMAYHLETKSFTQKGPSVDVKRINLKNKNHRPAFVAYDLIFYNGESLINLPLEDRMKILMKDKKVLEPKEGVVYLSEQRRVETKEEVMTALNEAIDALEEGLVVKELKSKYQVGKRDRSWLKIKPEFFSETSISDMDLVILGGYYTVGGMSYLVGLLDQKPGAKEVFYPVTEVGSGGLRKPELNNLIKELRPNFLKKENPQHNVLYKGKKKPDFYMNPKKSAVLQIKATQIHRNDSCALGFTLGFPRIAFNRPDKSWQDIMTLDEFRCLATSTGGKLAKRSDEKSPASTAKKSMVVSKYIKRSRGPKNESDDEDGDDNVNETRIDEDDSDEEVSQASRITRGTSKYMKKPAINNNNNNGNNGSPSTASSSKYFTIRKGYKNNRGALKTEDSSSSFTQSSSSFTQSRNANTTSPKSSKLASSPKTMLPLKSPVKVLNDTFESLVFFVSGDKEWKSRVEKEIEEHGGQIVQNPIPSIFACIAEKLSVRVDALAKAGVHDVLKYSWLEKSIQRKSPAPIIPEDCWSPGAQTLEKMSQKYDKFGDSYTKMLSVWDTKKLLNDVCDKLDKEDNNNKTNSIKLATQKQEKEQSVGQVASEMVEKSKRIWKDENFEEFDVRKLKKYDFLHGHKILFRRGDSSSSSSPPLNVELELKVQFYGGEVAKDEFEENITHIVVLDNDSEKSVDLNLDCLPSTSKGVFIVKSKWLHDSLEKKRRLDEKLYAI